MLIGAWGKDDGGNWAGKSYLMLASAITSEPVGSSISLANASYSFLGESADDRSGFVVSSAGDVDGDGRDDVFIAAPYRGSAFRNLGQTYLFTSSTIMAEPEGSALMLWEAPYSFRGGPHNGSAVAGAGDVDGDGFDDLLIGGHYDDTETTSNSGKVYLMLSVDLMTLEPVLPPSTFSIGAQASAIFSGEATQDRLAGPGSLASAGDVNGDGKPDLLFAASGNDQGEDGDPLTTDEGKTYLYLSPY